MASTKMHGGACSGLVFLPRRDEVAMVRGTPDRFRSRRERVRGKVYGRPVKMTNAAKASVWDVTYTPWGAPHTLTGAQTLNERFPGQWFQLESGLHYNWHRHVACPGPHRRAMRNDPGIQASAATPSPTL